MDELGLYTGDKCGVDIFLLSTLLDGVMVVSLIVGGSGAGGDEACDDEGGKVDMSVSRMESVGVKFLSFMWWSLIGLRLECGCELVETVAASCLVEESGGRSGRRMRRATGRNGLLLFM